MQRNMFYLGIVSEIKLLSDNDVALVDLYPSRPPNNESYLEIVYSQLAERCGIHLYLISIGKPEVCNVKVVSFVF